jgi:ABC-2 type transport system ATP-binding protein
VKFTACLFITEYYTTHSENNNTFVKHIATCMLRFENYKKGYDRKEVITIPQLNLEHGIYWLRGENGAGKTTLIKSIAGLTPFDGSIIAAGQDIRKNRIAYTAIVNYAEAEPIYPGFLNGNDLIRFYAKTKKAPQDQVAALSEKLGINNYADNKIATYSSGMAKKLSLVLGFTGNPKLILLDEPLITLDTRSVGILQDIILHSFEKGISFIITSHQEITLGTHNITRLQIENKTLKIL